MTNIGKSKEEIILELLISLNQGDVGPIDSMCDELNPRVQLALNQYEALVAVGVIKEGVI